MHQPVPSAANRQSVFPVAERPCDHGLKQQMPQQNQLEVIAVTWVHGRQARLRVCAAVNSRVLHLMLLLVLLQATVWTPLLCGCCSTGLTRQAAALCS